MEEGDEGREVDGGGAIIAMGCWCLCSLPWLGWWVIVHLWAVVVICVSSWMLTVVGTLVVVGACCCRFLSPVMMHVLWMVVICGQLSSLSSWMGMLWVLVVCGGACIVAGSHLWVLVRFIMVGGCGMLVGSHDMFICGWFLVVTMGSCCG